MARKSRTARCRVRFLSHLHGTRRLTWAWTGTPVDDRDYQVPFAFTGRLNRITVDIGETSVTPKALQEMQAHMRQRD
jgi:hypothetical protein